MEINWDILSIALKTHEHLIHSFSLASVSVINEMSTAMNYIFKNEQLLFSFTMVEI